MERKEFLQYMATLPIFASGLYGLSTFYNQTQGLKPSDIMPVLFLGHGSPMNGIEQNEYSESWQKLGESIPRPKMVLCISAHWLTKGTYVTAMQSPKTIHDFGGFPDELFQVVYPAPGSKMFAEEVKNSVTNTLVGLDEHEWGLDHGCWTIVRHMYPNADIPVLQLSIDYYKSPQYHYELGKQLASLRKKGVLIIGSGNLVHNLGKIAFQNGADYGYDWAIKADAEMKKYINDSNHQAMIEFEKQGSHWNLAIPSPDHYFPALYTLGLQDKKDSIKIFNDKPAMGSITMTSVMFG